MGGLGNQIFQIFTTISYSIKSKNPFKFFNIEVLGSGNTTIRYTYWNTFFNQLRPFLIDPKPLTNIVREKDFTYNNIDTNQLISRDIMLYGYFQSYKYFQEHYESICRIIGLENMKNNIKKNNNLSNEYLTNTISIHFRLGDYKKTPEFHPLATYDYYEKSLEFIQKQQSVQDFTILYFCEEDDHKEVLVSINKLVNKFPNYKFIRGDPMLQDWEQLLLMSCCHHNIIANSSFSWWAAYFNSNRDKIVCYPSLWFGSVANINTTDLCPHEWVKINV